MATWANLSLQDSASPLMEQLTFFHDHAMLILIMITTLVSYLLSTLFFNLSINRFLLEGQTIEIIWTILPAVTLVFIALPSLRLLYLLDEVSSPAITLKTVGHQWYWSYEYSDFLQVEFDSYMTPYNELPETGFRLLDVDNRAVLPMNTQVRMLVTAADVLHSWAVPALGVKVDATPGRLNQTSFLMNRPGLYFGQCSEICGANHSFMPIVIESVPTNTFINWVSSVSEA
uniref:Cytochrome c oxidase subunit 2 n=1 Tax=Perlomyia isobeae TaxID=2778728 RepID=A0A7L8ZV30_9NEOP|nr:cytochrome c oxidase subunit II [Perlomyia isobeae]YP_010835965.1 cytochrome c oxidase subunit II [Perlomyia kappa]YP_010835978.1 cytochrome c oxidase subunit II [Perlomyia levanidovae]QOI73911.1 cytochrome c oxidase subunit II [Perlomyia isobeae]WGC89484.1 cytochrome c oxidase subunit II [Perlomyia kappa]WGC89497.1 cytochrome c oxidase subunit II [Perlomyia levanidovae]